MPPLSVMIKPASGLCNLNCQYCFYRDETEKRARESFGFMDERTLKNVIRRTLLQAEGEACIVFQGGEPLLRGLDFFRKAMEYEAQYQQNGLRVRNFIQTNGTLLNEEWCRFFRDERFLVGVSVDGIGETHDLFRKGTGGEGTFRLVLEKTALLDRFQVEYNILTVVNRAVAESIDRIYPFYKKKGWMYQQYIACLDPLGEGGGDYSLMPETYGRFLIGLFDQWFADLKAGSAPSIRQFDNYIGILAGIPPEACDMRGSCGLQYAVEADGSVYPCDFYMTDAYRLGNFNTDRLPVIDRRREELRFAAESLEKPAECAACAYESLCRGGCRRHREASGGAHNVFCESYRMFFRARLPELGAAAELIRSRQEERNE